MTPKDRDAVLDMAPDEFRRVGHRLVDRISDFLAALPSKRVTPAESIRVLRDALHADRPLPEHGANAGELLERAAALMFEHSLFNGHPRFLAYITSSAA